MGMSDYVRGLRRLIGNELLFMPSVACVIRDEDGRLLLVRHVEGRWMLPGGAVDPGETPADAVRRECWEEAGVLVDPIRIAGVFSGPEYRVTYENGDDAGWVVTIFDAVIREGEPHPNDDETQDVGWFTREEADALEMGPSTHTTLHALLAGESFLAATWLPE
jgi:8-oxo-dGTP pyrophosphatase MutT (NUDIX family)